MSNQKRDIQPKQHQDRQPGFEHQMNPLPEYLDENYKGSEKLKGKTAIITGGDSGIGRSVSLYFAKEGADIAILYLDEQKDAEMTKQLVEAEGQTCKLYNGDIGGAEYCEKTVEQIKKDFGRIDILVNNAAMQYPQDDLTAITNQQLEKTFRVNFFSYVYMAKAVLPHLPKGGSIINTSSVTAYQGNEQLIDYSSTKGAITSFTRSLAKSLVKKGIRVNGVAPGPIWTPLIPASFDKKKVAEFGSTNPMGRPGQPRELAPAYVYLAGNDSSYVTGQMIHINGGVPVNG
ncbi:NAD(P)-dependent dehydrogenase, short-chain alcohol dehydrogenase family [Halobacillus karajensis]|uniref:General stress protein 39 n=1 Tax=Halobacillus karajensis TaxID=195088 RepID=A0A024P7Y5_9BACI|nr:SDR family oxidoreductase [Halobacillus karajensis]CDQ20973.1 General stress protein 39 [Halobacillus karajensis]CDQ24963.1 General stress protein 39 [Halobacillus karajensis]CDQ28676.1 General stress protein 39 [Halobacillus karajensis]SEH97818.1 NAD(P)-dependent dehydrogenase, short-chain alcohol dehydrogenase family [Halobacillus karajensis]